MKTTLDLPDALIRELEQRAIQQGQELEETVADLLRKGLAATPTSDQDARPLLRTHPKTGLTYLECAHAATPAEEMTPTRVAEILLNQEVAWRHEAGR